jgi:hypothetical protein
MTLKILIASLALIPCVALAQVQYTKPGVDSTHVHGIAQRVMPEFSGGGVGGGAAPPSDPGPPTTVPDLLSRWTGMYIDFPETGFAYRVDMYAIDVFKRGLHGRMDLVCQLTDASRLCRWGGPEGDLSLSQGGLFWIASSCPYGWAGAYQGQAEYQWMDYLQDGGKPAGGVVVPANMKRVAITNTCREEGGG